MSLKIYIHLELEGFTSQTSKIQVPKSWSSKPVKDVIGLFLSAYNKKNPEQTLDLENVHFATEEGRKMYSDETVEVALEDHTDYYIKQGQYVKPSVVQAAVDPDLLRCRNYGCQKFFRESENNDTACQHHTGPPIFHDTMKCWSCCRDRKAFDFESFQLIAGCAEGRHSIVPPNVAISASPNAHADSSAAGEAAPLKSIAEFNTNNPTAASAASSATKTMERKSTRAADGTARCQRKGCQKVFNVAENSPAACTYHRGQPVFHDAIKFWSCCPEIKCYDFDEFLAVKGCTVGIHDDGVVELE